MNQDPKLLEGFHGAVAALDTQARAWVVVVARLVDLEPRGPFSDDEMRQLIDEATAAGDFPSGPMAYAPEHEEYEEYEVNPDYHLLTVRSRLAGEPYLESKIAFGIAGFLAEGFTRSGRITDDGDVHPSHVLLIDLEAVLAETILLLSRAARMLGYVGPGRIMAGIAAEVPAHPLRLRALDERIGDLMDPGPPVEEFEPLTVDLTIGGSRADAHRRCYEAITSVAPQFGVSKPQYFTHPDQGTDDYDLGQP